ncbi:Casparian strip membrane protein [Trema orientale]|uniref:CASP-like protein n=1 Tax=Trema orientale TaxID=63057 RepID=A0A2P5CPJ6_TREOI|nr:Casparian strip membrane protein [Trema orientale]
MDSKQNNDEAVLIPKNKSKGKAVVDASPAPAAVGTTKATLVRRVGWKKGVAIVDFVLRLGAAAAAFAAAAAVGQAEEVLPFFTQFLQFHAQYNDLPTLAFFVIANAAVGGYLVLSLPFSITCIVRPHKVGPRLLLIILDSVMTALIISAAASAGAIMYLAHNGSVDANWIAICQQYTNFCQQITGAVVASFVAAVFLITMVAVSAFALKRTTTTTTH